MGYDTNPIVNLLDEVSGGKVTGLMATIESLKGANKSLEGTIKSLEGTIESLEGTIESLKGTIKSLEGELPDARSSRGFAVLALHDVGKISKEISKTLKLDLSEVNRILGNGLLWTCC
jgi:predicted  nucleic acid-binding Zn-ribbon protein